MGIVKEVTKSIIHAYILFRLSCGKSTEEIEQELHDMISESTAALFSGEVRRLQTGG